MFSMYHIIQSVNFPLTISFLSQQISKGSMIDVDNVTVYHIIQSVDFPLTISFLSQQTSKGSVIDVDNVTMYTTES